MYSTFQGSFGREMYPNNRAPPRNNVIESYNEYPTSSYASPFDDGTPQHQDQYTMNEYSSCNSCDNPTVNTNTVNQGSQNMPQQQYPPNATHYSQPNPTQEAPKTAPITIHDKMIAIFKQNVVNTSLELGVGPNMVDVSPDGRAIWKHTQMLKGNSIWSRVFNRVEVFAERKSGKKPITYIGSITTTTKIKLDKDLVKDLQHDMPQICYCPASQLLHITMDTLSHNLAILTLVCAAQQGKISVAKIRYYNLPKKYINLTTPGNKKYKRGAKYAMIRYILN